MHCLLLLYPFIRRESPSSHCLFELAKTCGNHLGLGLVSVAYVVDTQSASLGLLQLLHGQYGAKYCHVTKGHL
jgi:hypothetical protein